MWKTRREYEKLIKEKQREMYNLSREKGRSHEEVYTKSCELDGLINDYMKIYHSGVAIRIFS